MPYAITVDFQTLEGDGVTLRERDTMTQVRVPVADIAPVIRQLVDGTVSWADVAAKYPAQKAAADEEQQ